MSVRALFAVCLAIGGSCSFADLATGEPSKAYSFRGIEPGSTTTRQLQADSRWGEPKKKQAGKEGTERWYYKPRGYREAVATIRASRVQTIDIYLPSGITVDEVAAALKLGIPVEAESLTPAAQIGVEIPPAWEAILYSAGRVVLFADPQSNHAMLVRSYASHIVGLPAAAAAPAIKEESPTTPDSSSTLQSALRGQNRGSQEIVAGVAKLLPHYHISRHPLDDQIAERALGLQLDYLDPSRLYFTRQDVTRFRRQVDRADDRLRQGDLSLSYDVFRTFLKRVGERLQLVDQLLDANHDFSADEEWVVLGRKAHWAENELELREVWRKRVKHQLLTYLEANKDLGDAQRKVARTMHAFADQQARKDDDELLAFALSAVFNAYDPRSDYYSPTEWENSQIVLVSEMVGIGASLQIRDEYLEVVKLVAGSPSHVDGRLKPGDRIVAVGEGRDGEMVEVTGMKLADAVHLIRGTEGTVVRLRVLPKGGFEGTIIDIQRAKFELQKISYTVLREKEHGRTGAVSVGFVHLPTIYTDVAAQRENKKDYRSTSRDMRRVLASLKKEDVDVLLLDLRDNPGGSLSDSIELTGLFAGSGTVIQVRDGAGKIDAYAPQQVQPGEVWDRPLVVLTNKGTSGGPEILAAAVQDYRRGIVIGDSTTNGNGTVATQQFVTALLGGQNQADEKPARMGVARFVQQKFYRVNGDGFQARGVVPEVTLPSISDASFETQADLQYSLAFDRIEPATFTPSSNSISKTDVDRIRQWSAMRRAEASFFRQLEPRLAELREQRSQQIYPLNRDKFRAAQRKLQEQTNEAPPLSDIPEVKLDGYLRECLAVALDYAAECHLAAAEQSLKDRRYEKALRAYRRAVAANPLRQRARYRLAWALSTLPSSRYRDGKQAVEHARKLCEMDGRKTWSYLLTLAIAEAEAGNFGKAKEELTAALDKAPEKQRSKYAYLKSRFERRKTFASQ